MNLPARPLKMSSLKESLEGSWIFKREITGMMPLTGRANFSEQAEGLLYREELSFPAPSGKTLAAHREYFYHFSDNNLAVYFAYEGKPAELFMELTLSGPGGELTAQGSHLCKNDNYIGDFCFSGPQEFSVIYTVKGPAKDYLIKSLYTRESGK